MHRGDEQRRANERDHDGHFQLPRAKHEPAEDVGKQHDGAPEKRGGNQQDRKLRADKPAHNVRGGEPDEGDRPGCRGSAAGQEHDPSRGANMRSPLGTAQGEGGVPAHR